MLLSPHYRCVLDYGDVMPNYPKIGVRPKGRHITNNADDPYGYVGAIMCALERQAMLVGAPAATATSL